jgi:redox-sensitive bicupin YhaK (pirin superfamily)
VNDRLGQFQNIVSPNPDDDGVWINQDAWFFLGDFQMNDAIRYDIKRPENGAYFFILEGSAMVAGEELKRRDGLGVEDASSIEISTTENCQLLVIEVPLNA